MTDLTTKDNKYYTVSQFNPTNNNVNAQTNDVLLYPIIENASDYQVAISKARIDLSGIPLTTHNIPLKTYEVGLKNGNDEYTAFVRQLNAENKNYLYNVSTGGTYSKYVYLTGGTTTQVNLPNAIPISSYLTNVYQFIETDFQNVFIVGSTDTSENYNTLIGFNSGGSVIYQNVFSSIQAMCLDRQSNLYLAIESGTGSVIEVYHLLETSNPIGFNLVQTITQDANGSPLSQIQTMCAEAQLIVGSQANTITIYDTISWNPITTYTEASITQLGNSSAILSGYDRFCVEDKGNLPDLLFGLAFGGSTPNTLINLETESVFNSQGTWALGKKTACSAKSGAGYGLGTDNYLYGFGYNPVDGTTTVNTLISGDVYENVCNGTQEGGVYVLYQASQLLGMNAENNPNGSTSLSTLDDTFAIGGSLPLQLDSQINTHRLVGLDTSNTLHITSAPVLLKSAVSISQNSTNTNYIMSQDAVGAVIGGTATPPQALTMNQVQYTQSPVANTIVYHTLAHSRNNNEYLLLFQDTNGNTLNCSILNANFTVSSSIDVTTAIGIGEPPYGLCDILGTNICITNRSNTVYIFNYAGTVISTITLPTFGTQYPSFQVSCTSDGYLAISSNTNIYIYDVNTPSAPVLKSNQTFTPVGLPTQYIGGIHLEKLSGPDYELYFTANGTTPMVGGFPQLTSLYSAPITSPSFTFTSPPSLLSVLPEGQVACRFLQSVYVNKFVTGTEVSIKLQTGTSTSPSSQVYTYNVTGNFFNQYSVTPTTNLVDFVPLERTLGQYTWLPITATGAGTIVGFGISQTNPNLIYALNTAGTCFSGILSLTPTPSIAFSEYTAVTTANATINVLPQPTSQFDWYVKNFNISSQTAHGEYHYSSTPVYSIARNAISGEFLVSAGGTLTSYAPSDFSSQWTNATITGLNLIYSKNSEDIDAGDANIYDFQTLIDAINVAFEEAFAKAPSGVFTQAPSVSLNFNNGLATLTYSSDYTSTTKGILMNSNLHQLLYYFSVKDDFNPNFFRVVLPANSTSLTQTSKSLYLFNQLDKILFISNTIFVFGSYFGANNTNNIITDIDVPTNSDGYMNNLGQVVYYQPSFLRPFILSSNIPLSRIQMEVWYSTLSGEQYQLQLVPDGNWNAKLIFPRRY